MNIQCTLVLLRLSALYWFQGGRNIVCETAYSVQDYFPDVPPVSYSNIASGGRDSSYLDVITTEEAASLVSVCGCVYMCNQSPVTVVSIC